ncbi:hypothetical protein SCANM63S_07947 [Streptomyces canarius]
MRRVAGPGRYRVRVLGPRARTTTTPADRPAAVASRPRRGGGGRPRASAPPGPRRGEARAWSNAAAGCRCPVAPRADALGLFQRGVVVSRGTWSSDPAALSKSRPWPRGDGSVAWRDRWPSPSRASRPRPARGLPAGARGRRVRRSPSSACSGAHHEPRPRVVGGSGAAFSAASIASPSKTVKRAMRSAWTVRVSVAPHRPGAPEEHVGVNSDGGTVLRPGGTPVVQPGVVPLGPAAAPVPAGPALAQSPCRLLRAGGHGPGACSPPGGGLSITCDKRVAQTSGRNGLFDRWAERNRSWRRIESHGMSRLSGPHHDGCHE